MATIAEIRSQYPNSTPGEWIELGKSMDACEAGSAARAARRALTDGELADKIESYSLFVREMDLGESAWADELDLLLTERGRRERSARSGR